VVGEQPDAVPRDHSAPTAPNAERTAAGSSARASAMPNRLV
jgi:hypothetical protein